MRVPPDLDAILRPSRQMIRWSGDEGQELAERMHRCRARHPELNLIELANRVQEATQQDPWPSDRRRKIAALVQIQPLLSLLRGIDLEMRGTLERELPALKDQIASLSARPAKEELLAALSEEEIVRRFTAVVLRSLASAEVVRYFPPRELLAAMSLAELHQHVNERTFGEIDDLRSRLAELTAAVRSASEPAEQAASHPRLHGPHAKAVPKLAIVGCQQHQLGMIQAHVHSRAQLLFISKGAAQAHLSELSASDHCFVMEAFTSDADRRSCRQALASKSITSFTGTIHDLLQAIDPHLAPLAARLRRSAKGVA